MTNGYIPGIEQHVIGAILSGGDCSVVLRMLEPDYFVEPIHARLFELCRVAHDRYSSTTLPVVSKLIDEQLATDFKTASGHELGPYLAKCVSNTVYGSGSLAKGARNVINQWARIRLATDAGAVAAAASDPAADPVELVRSFGAAMDDVMSSVRRGGRGKTRHTIMEASKDAIQASREARANKGLTGITTGLVDLDRATGGLQRRDLIVAGGRPGMGKTTFGTNVARAAATAGHGVGFLSLEMDTRKLVTRFQSDIAFGQGAKVAYQDIINGVADDIQLGAVAEAMGSFGSLPIWIEDQSGLTISDIRVKVEAMIAEADQAGFSIDLLVVDHLLKVRPSRRYAGQRVQEIAEITDGLKEMAREYDMAVLLLTQLNREVEKRDDKRPTLADLRDSGAIEQDADTIMLLYREAYYLEREKPQGLTRQMEQQADLAACVHKAEIDIAKQRNGRVQSVEVWADMSLSAFRNAARPGQVGSFGR
jgi:replicative DNA helicase